MRNSWLMWIIALGVVIIIYVSLSYQKHEVVPLSQIFPDDQAAHESIEYEYVDKEAAGTTPAVGTAKSSKTVVASAQTTVKSVEAKAAPAIALSTSLEGIVVTIQVLSSKDKVAAGKKVSELQSKGFDAFLLPKDLGEKGIWYRICIGKFISKADAEETLSKVKTIYKDSFIIFPTKRK